MIMCMGGGGGGGGVLVKGQARSTAAMCISLTVDRQLSTEEASGAASLASLHSRYTAKFHACVFCKQSLGP